ncbi:winged helix DNA-binding protein [Haladaptatus sp. YSMS36]|uniref:HVO_A0114 family putative DNA-binding protein n=1 Tax=Haladaptatus sp. YSMS36 TaxID=3033384 RepID=UPI0023E79D35|nr:winged helix DNA-binding protein [Haladaptatus sp. YSMS36]
MNKTNSTEDAPHEHRTLTVRVGTPDDGFDKVEARLAALDAGDDSDPLYEVVLQREADLQRLLSANNVQLLQTIARREPQSIRELARFVDRDVRGVHDNLSELERLGLVEFVQEGRAKKPTVWYDDITIELPVAVSESDPADDTAEA